MSEDERYRTSTQFRLWSFTPSSLHAIRETTNLNAANRVRAAVQRLREARAASSAETSEAENGRAVSAVPEGEVDCLTVEEELKLVAFYCRQTIQLGDHLKVPTDVKVCAIPFLMLILELINIICVGNSNTVYQTLLYYEQFNDLPPHRHPEDRALLRD
jgi:cyclin H